jgi:thiol-disulfide isomerase/thioredoxin
MKNISLILLLLVNYTLFSQETAKYYRQGNKTFNEIEYKVHKESYLNDFKKLFPDATLSEEFIKTIQTTDSTIVYFTLGLHVNQQEEIKSTLSKEPIYSMIGKKFPFEQFPSLNEKEILGKPSLINLWFIACPPCQEEIPSLNTLQKEFSEHVNFIAITFDKNVALQKFLKQKPYNFKQVSDAKVYLDKIVTNYPKNIFLNKDGIIVEIEGNVTLKINEKQEFIFDLTGFRNKLKSLL